MVHIDTQDLAEELLRVLRSVVGVVGRATIAQTNIEKTIWTKFDHPAVVIGKRLRDGEENRFLSIRHIPIAGRDVIFRNHRRAVRLTRIVHKKASIVREPRMKREPEQSSLT